MPSADQLKRLQALEPLEIEGGYYRETYRSDERVPAECLPKRYGRDKSFCTAIYYLLTPETHSRLHRLPTDEIFHFHLGDPVEMLQLHPDGRSEIVVIGPDVAAGQQLQVVVPRGTWQGCRLRAGGSFALMGVTVAPGFDFSDYEPADAEALIQRHPERRELIVKLTAPSPDGA
jgi:predicted cupin superfamily sugar epimerase